MNTYTTTNATNGETWLYKSCCCSLPYEQCCGAKSVSVPSVWTDADSSGYLDSTVVWPPQHEGRIRRAIKAFIAAWKGN